MEAFLARRRDAQDSSDSDDDETAAALAAAQQAREQRRVDERTGDRLVARLAALAESASTAGRWMEAIELYTRALAERPNDTELLAQRASACARAGHYAAALHDGELMVRLTPDWYRGFQVRRCTSPLRRISWNAPARQRCCAHRVTWLWLWRGCCGWRFQRS
jgi:tetratricopeptide (TPR) repeat protein